LSAVLRACQLRRSAFRPLCATLVTALLSVSCSTLPREIGNPLAGRLLLEISPNPIIAEHVEGRTYDFPFDIIMRETGGVDVTIDDFTVDITLLGVVTLFSQKFPATEISRRGYPVEIGSGKFLRFSFRKRKEVPNDLVFRSAIARVTAHTTDTNGRRGETKLEVQVRRR